MSWKSSGHRQRRMAWMSIQSHQSRNSLNSGEAQLATQQQRLQSVSHLGQVVLSLCFVSFCGPSSPRCHGELPPRQWMSARFGSSRPGRAMRRETCDEPRSRPLQARMGRKKA